LSGSSLTSGKAIIEDFLTLSNTDDLNFGTVVDDNFTSLLFDLEISRRLTRLQK